MEGNVVQLQDLPYTSEQRIQIVMMMNNKLNNAIFAITIKGTNKVHGLSGYQLQDYLQCIENWAFINLPVENKSCAANFYEDGNFLQKSPVVSPYGDVDSTTTSIEEMALEKIPTDNIVDRDTAICLEETESMMVNSPDSPDSGFLDEDDCSSLGGYSDVDSTTSSIEEMALENIPTDYIVDRDTTMCLEEPESMVVNSPDCLDFLNVDVAAGYFSSLGGSSHEEMDWTENGLDALDNMSLDADDLSEYFHTLKDANPSVDVDAKYDWTSSEGPSGDFDTKCNWTSSEGPFGEIDTKYGWTSSEGSPGDFDTKYDWTNSEGPSGDFDTECDWTSSEGPSGDFDTFPLHDDLAELEDYYKTDISSVTKPAFSDICEDIQSSDQNILAQYMLDIVMQSDDEALKEQFREDWSRGIHQNPSADLVGVFIEFLFAIVIVLASIREICGRT